jgi:hypothetical protein
MRMVNTNHHDHLVGFQVVDIDHLGCSLAWRILHTWPVSGAKYPPRPDPEQHPGAPPGPEWLEGLSFEELVKALAAVREHARPRLLDVPKELQDRHARLVGALPQSYGARTGFARILRRFGWDVLIELREGGAYYSFLTGSNSYDDDPDLGLEQGSFKSGFAGGDKGWFLDLGDVPFVELGDVLNGSIPSGLDLPEREAANFLGQVRAELAADGRRQISPEDLRLAEELGISDYVRAFAGHTYLLRSVLFDSHDHLVVFTVIDEDESGLSLVYNVLQSWTVPATGR